MNEIIIADRTPQQALVTVSETPIDQNPAVAFLASRKSNHTRRNNGRYLAQIANGLLYHQWQTPSREQYDNSADYHEALTRYKQTALTLNWSALRFQHTQAIQVKLLEHYKEGTVNVMLSALRGVIKQAWKLGQIGADDYRRAVDVENVKYKTLPAGRDLQQGEILSLSSACLEDDSPAGVRDAAIVGILYTCGLRRSELAKLKLADYTAETGLLKIISGKGRKDRTVYVTNGAKEALTDWLALRGDDPGYLFLPVNKGGAITHARTDDHDTERPASVTAQAIYNMLKKRAEQAGVKDFSPHDFRRTAVGDMLDRGVDIATVANILGHASVDTTRRYDRRPEATKQQAAQKLHFPYNRRRAV